MENWWQLIAAALGGGITVKLIEIGHQEYRDWKGKRLGDAKFVDEGIEPLLKATNELVGKLRSLAEQDFLPIRRVEGEWVRDTDVSSLIFLFVQFWSHVEIVRSSHITDVVGQSEKGRKLLKFLNCLESRRVRLIDRISQRAIGEAAIVSGRSMNYVEFIKSFENDDYMNRWMQPLIDVLSNADSSAQRQSLLQNSVILHAMIDTLDPKHSVTDDRPATPNKLNRGSWRDLNFRVFDVYLNFVPNRSKYIGPPKGRP